MTDSVRVWKSRGGWFFGSSEAGARAGTRDKKWNNKELLVVFCPYVCVCVCAKGGPLFPSRSSFFCILSVISWQLPLMTIKRFPFSLLNILNIYFINQTETLRSFLLPPSRPFRISKLMFHIIISHYFIFILHVFRLSVCLSLCTRTNSSWEFVTGVKLM